MRDPFFKDALWLYAERVTQHDPHVKKESYEFLKHLFTGMKQEDLSPAKFINGNDLISLGYKPGPKFKEILDKVENGQLTGHIKSKEDALEMIRSGRI
jgi:poly(A) polymerase